MVHHPLPCLAWSVLIYVVLLFVVGASHKFEKGWGTKYLW